MTRAAAARQTPSRSRDGLPPATPGHASFQTMVDSSAATQLAHHQIVNDSSTHAARPIWRRRFIYANDIIGQWFALPSTRLCHAARAACCSVGAFAVSRRDDKLTPPRPDARTRRDAYPRVSASINVSVTAEDRRSGAAVRSGAIGGLPRFEPSGVKVHRSPGELGPAPERGQATPPIARAPRPADPEGEGAEGEAAAAASGKADSSRRAAIIPPRAAPSPGLAGLPGLGVALGELGSPARTEAVTPAADAPKFFLGRLLRSVPSLVDVSVSIGAGPPHARAIGRVAMPLRALVGKRVSSSEATGRVSPPPATGMPTIPAGKSPTDDPGAVAPSRLAPDPALDPDALKRPSRLRRASRYIVNGILEIAVRRFQTPSDSRNRR
jgi:hypothetical protein